MLRSVTRRVHVFKHQRRGQGALAAAAVMPLESAISAETPTGGNLGMKRESKFDVSRLSVETGGMGDPAVFVHGFGSNKFTWRKVCRGLKDVFCFYAVDLPGSGASPAPRDFHYTLEHFADVLTDFIVVKDLKKLTLVGHSLGATIILLAFLRNKGELARRVRSLCLIDAIVYLQAFPLFMDILRTPVLGPLALNSPAFVKVFLLPFSSLLPSYRRRNVREALIETASLINIRHFARYSQLIKTIQVPTLVIWGREDNIVPLKLGKRLARELWRARLIVVDDCGHAPHEECTAEVIAALREFARTISRQKTKQAKIADSWRLPRSQVSLSPGVSAGAKIPQ